MKQTQPFAVALLLCLSSTAGASEPDPPAAEPDVAPRRGWSASVAGDRQSGPVEPGAAELRLTIYEGGRRLGPVLDRRGQVMEVEVAAELENCPDGNTVVRALDIGGYRYRLDESCADLSRGSEVTVSMQDTQTVTTSRPTQGTAARDRRIVCDPQTWSCRTAER
jgi:hypothetical protein